MTFFSVAGIVSRRATTLGIPPVTANLKVNINKYSSMLDTTGGSAVSIGQGVGWIEDLSGTGNHFLQATAGFRPLKHADGLDFDGTDDRMSCTLVAGVATPFSLYIRADFPINTNRSILSANTNSSIVGQATSSTLYTHLAGSSPISVAHSVAGWRNFVIIANGASSVVELDATQQTGTFNSTTWTSLLLAEYSATWMNTTVAALLLYTGAHDTSTRTTIKNWLSTL